MIDPKTGLSATPSEILNSLRNLVQTANEKGMGLGGMTAADRDSWYQVYNELSKSIKVCFIILSIKFYDILNLI